MPSPKAFRLSAAAFACAALLALASCQSMGRQFAARPFPPGNTVYLEPGIQNLYGEGPAFEDAELLALWSDMAAEILAARGYSLVAAREEAAFELYLRGGPTSTRRVAGVPLFYVGFRLQMLDVAKGRTVFNQWFEVGSQLGDRKLSYKDAVLEFTQEALAGLPERLD